MRTVLLLRHGEAADGSRFADDHERPLTERGEMDAALVGRYLASTGVYPHFVMSSTARRALSTAEIARTAGGWEAVVRETPQLYLPAPRAVLDSIQQTPRSARVALLVGHEPAWSRTASGLIGGGRMTLAAGAIARIDFDVGDWEEVAFGEGALDWLLPPAALGSLIRTE
jgi:phosphohistidine phosphatase